VASRSRRRSPHHAYGDFKKVEPVADGQRTLRSAQIRRVWERGVLLLNVRIRTNVDRSGYTESERAVAPRLAEMFMARRADRHLLLQFIHPPAAADSPTAADEYGRKVAVHRPQPMNTATEDRATTSGS